MDQIGSMAQFQINVSATRMKQRTDSRQQAAQREKIVNDSRGYANRGSEAG
jgi:hypothetical protein